ncbi:MAG: hypothetical protein Q7R39_06545 [Dehalococcoidia bacterium]|nr:hypothetical protein [Dehalococcoidia bacterium]
MNTTPTIRPAIIRAYDAGTNTATVQIAGSHLSYLAGVPVAQNVWAALVVPGVRAGIVFFDDSNPTDACLAFVY